MVKEDLEKKVEAQLQQAAKQNGWSVKEEIKFRTELEAENNSSKNEHTPAISPNSDDAHTPTQTRYLIPNKDVFLDILHDEIRYKKQEMLTYQMDYEDKRSKLLSEINKLDADHKETLDDYSNLEIDLKDISRKVKGRKLFNLKCYITYETLENGDEIPVDFELEDLGRKTVGFNKEPVSGSYGIEKKETYTQYIQPPPINSPKPK